MSARLRPINWYTYNEELDEIVVNQEATKKHTFSILFDLVSDLFWYILIIFGSLNFYFKLFSKNDFIIEGINISVISELLTQLTLSFRLCVYLFYFISFLIYKFSMVAALEIYERTDRYIIILSWMTYCYFLLQANSDRVINSFFYLRATIIAVIITSINYLCLSVVMLMFENNFQKKTLKFKIIETTRTEKILKKLKQFTYDIDDSSNTSDDLWRLSELFCLDLDTWNTVRFDTNLEHQSTFRNLKDPEIYNIRDVKKLSNDIFARLSSDLDILTEKSFFEIFGDAEYANTIFLEFDVNHVQMVTRESFTNTLIYYFRQRALLSKSLVSTSNFVNIIKTIVYFASFLFLIIIFLIVFGANVKELFAFIVSSAIIMNFLGSGMVKEMWKNILFLISHQFDIGDEIIIDNKDMVVHDIGLIATSMLLDNGGTIKLVNSDLWSKSIINMTKAPEKLLLFTLNLPSNTSKEQILSLKSAILAFVKDRPFELNENFVVASTNTGSSTIKQLETSILLKFKNHNSRSKKFTIRSEFTAYLKTFLESNSISFN